MSDYSYGIVTVSDRCHSGESTDESGPAIKTLLQRHFKAFKISQSTVPDEEDEIKKILLYYCDELKLHVVFTTGGTGFAPRDVTPEVTKGLIHRECPNLALAMTLESLKKTPFAVLSRSVCGIRDKTLIINFPGSKKAVVECFESIQSVLPHAIQLIRDEKVLTSCTHENLQKDFKFPLDVNKTLQDVASLNDTTDNSTSMQIDSEMSGISDFLDNSSTTMNEIILDDEILKMPTRKDVVNRAEKPFSTSTSMASLTDSESSAPRHVHVCPHKTAKPGDQDDRNSTYPMIDVSDALTKIFASVGRMSEPTEVRSPMDCPPFRASIKDGYAVKSSSTSRQRKVIGNVSAGDRIVQKDFGADECFKINTGAALPAFADAIVQVEDTKLLSSNNDGSENLIELMELPKKNCDVRGIGCDIAEGELLFDTKGLLGVPERTILASVGLLHRQKTPKIAIISTGDELVDPNKGGLREGQIYDSNSTMLKLLLEKFGFEVHSMAIAKDDYGSLKKIVSRAVKECDVVISSGGVSMGDKDFVKPLLQELGFEIVFGRVNMKPGKPMTFASNGNTSYFALPGNPVSSYVCFHVFVLPALRFMVGFSEAKCKLPVINVILAEDKYVLDSRPEFARASISFIESRGHYHARMPQNQMSSRLASLINADVLLHLPGGTEARPSLNRGFNLRASILNHHFISSYQP